MKQKMREGAETNINKLEVWAGGMQVGTLAEMKDYRIAFEYSKEWLENGFSISPLSLPLKPGIFVPKSYDPFDGLFGVFVDSLPDGWGALLVDRMMKQNGIDSYRLNSLERLAIIGTNGKGLLEYRPSSKIKNSFTGMDFDDLQKACTKILEDKKTDKLETLFEFGSSSGGARPKINASYSDNEWIIKFQSSNDSKEIGLEEFKYLECAKNCGIEVPEYRLFPSTNCPGYFGSARFDRVDGKKIHMISVSGLLETSHRIPNLDYDLLLKLTMILTNDKREVERMFRLACFNVFSHNRDDHAKNFSFLYQNGSWKLSPAYDLTWSNSIGGEHATTIHNNGTDLLACANTIGIEKKQALSIISEVKNTVLKELDSILKKYK